MFELFVQKGKK